MYDPKQHLSSPFALNYFDCCAPGCTGLSHACVKLAVIGKHALALSSLPKPAQQGLQPVRMHGILNLLRYHDPVHDQVHEADKPYFQHGPSSVIGEFAGGITNHLRAMKKGCFERGRSAGDQGNPGSSKQFV